jgi:predicted ATPase
MIRLNRGEPQLALQQLEAAETLVAEQRLGYFIEPRFVRGAALSLQGACEQAVACLREGLAAPLRATFVRPYGLALFAEALARRSEHRAALEAVREGLEAQERLSQRWWEAELHRLEGVALVGLNRLQEGESAFEVALLIARQQQAKSYELRAATSLARLWRDQGKCAEARDLLAPVYDWFTEGFNTADLKEAKGLLNGLSEPGVGMSTVSRG